MKKSIAFIRTSTDQQSIEDQQKELVNYIVSDGHTEEQIIIVGDRGASAIKEDEKYLAYIEEIKELINRNDIDCVYAWEVSRIARHRSTFYVLVDFLKLKNVNLKIMKPSLSLYDKDGKLNGASDLAISVLVTMAEHEMILKQDRFERAKKGLKEKGLFCGGSVAYGYKVVDKKIVVDEEQAKVVREVYDLYANKGVTIRKIYKELEERGVNVPFSSLCHMFRKKCYIGDNTENPNMQYPQIISEEIFYKARQVAANNNCMSDKTTKHHFFGSKLIKCPECGHSLVGGVYKDGYVLYDCVHCNAGICLNGDMMDGLLWYHASILERFYIANEQAKVAEETEKEIEVLKSKIEHSKEITENLEKKLERVNTVYINGGLTFENYDRKTKDIKKEINQVKQQALSWETDILNLSNPMKSVKTLFSGEKEQMQYLEWVNGLVAKMDNEKKMQDIVRRHIKRVDVEKSKGNKKIHYDISIQCKNGKEYNYRYYSRLKDKLYRLDLNGEESLMFETPYIYRVGDKLYDDYTYQVNNLMGQNRKIDYLIKNNTERKLRMALDPANIDKEFFDIGVMEKLK